MTVRVLLSALVACLSGVAGVVAAAETPALDVSISVFDPGVPDDPAAHHDLRIFPQIRAIEAKLLPFALRRALVTSGEWGVVRIVSDADEAAEVLVQGTILHSDGERLELLVRVQDASGRAWFEDTFTDTEGDADESASGTIFEDLFAAVAARMHEANVALGTGTVPALKELALLRYGNRLVPSVFGRYLEEGDDGIWIARSLPARDDPMLSRIDRIRRTEFVIIDTVDERYQQLFEDIGSVYSLWRDYRLKTVRYEAQNERRAANSGPGGSPGSYEALLKRYEDYKWNRLTAQELDRLAVAFDNEAGPVIERLETRVAELDGWVEDKYLEWQRLLAELFEVETRPEPPLPLSGERSLPAE